jgi:tRNA (cmo5U34)-methyltransferase
LSQESGTDAWFDRWVDSYDAGRRRLIPCFDSFYGTAVEVASLGRAGPVRVLDLGAGTGILSAMVAEALPEAELVLLDEAPGMLERARERLGEAAPRCRIVVANFADQVPDGPFDVIVSALAIHHVDDDAKRRLFARLHDRLSPGGAFVNAEQVSGPNPRLDALYAERWRTRATTLGTTEHEHAEAAERMSVDRPSSVEAQLRWLTESGFVDVDCFFKWWNFAVYGGWRDV